MGEMPLSDWVTRSVSFSISRRMAGKEWKRWLGRCRELAPLQEGGGGGGRGGGGGGGGGGRGWGEAGGGGGGDDGLEGWAGGTRRGRRGGVVRVGRRLLAVILLLLLLVLLLLLLLVGVDELQDERPPRHDARPLGRKSLPTRCSSTDDLHTCGTETM